MRKEIQNWWAQAQKDLEKARWLHKGEHFDGTALYCQQSVERAPKSLILFSTKRKKVDGHSLLYLGRLAKVPDRFLPGLRKLSPGYFISRYPDVTEEAPYELYDEQGAKEYIDFAMEVLDWIRPQLK